MHSVLNASRKRSGPIRRYLVVTYLMLMAVAFNVTLPCSSAFAGPVEIRFAQGDHLYTGVARYPGRGYLATLPLRDFILQNIAVVNTGEEEFDIQNININIYAGDKLLQSHTVDLEDTVRVLGLLQQYAGLGLQAALDVAFGAGKMIGEGEIFSKDLSLASNEAIIITDNFITIKGTPDKVTVTAVAVTAGGETIEASNSIKVLNEGVKNDYIFPLETAHWYVYSNVDPVGHHRYTQSTEFAIDATILDGEGKMYKGDGLKWEDWYAYNKRVLAAADGTVVLAVDGTDFPLIPLMRQAEESWPEYMGRIGKRQMSLMMDKSKNLYQSVGGNHVVIRHDNGEYTWYVHLAKGSVRVKPDQRVSQGEHIAGVGGTGENPNVHLHFQVTDGLGTMAHGLPFEFVDHTPYNKVLNTSKPIDAGRYYWLNRDGFPTAN